MDTPYVPKTDNGAIDNDGIIERSQNLRWMMIDEMTADGVPRDSDGRRELNEMLMATERSALAHKRVGVDEKAAESDEQIAQLIQTVLKDVRGNPFERETIEGHAERIEESITLPEIEIDDGVTEIGIITKDYDTFMREMDGIEDARLKGDDEE